MQTVIEVKKNLLDYLLLVKDPRRLQGQRHELKHILLITIMSIMSGNIGYRSIGDFMKSNKGDLLKALQPKNNKLPSFDIIRQVLISLDFNELSNQFYEWSKQYISISSKEWISIDGKAIAGTVKDACGINQRFVSLVSLYCSKQKLVLSNALVSNNKNIEMTVVPQLIAALDLKDVVFTLDALHCQKKQ